MIFCHTVLERIMLEELIRERIPVKFCFYYFVNNDFLQIRQTLMLTLFYPYITRWLLPLGMVTV